MDDAIVRESVAALLTKGQAHVMPRKALAGIPAEARCKHPLAGMHSLWEQLEHLRIAQEDILRYTLDPAWKSPPFPGGYWPAATESVTDEAWNTSVTRFLSDLNEVVALARNPAIDLTAAIPHGERRTYLRQVLLVADHNAYHLGEVVLIRRALGAWA